MSNTLLALYIIDITALLFLFGLLHGDKMLGNRRKRAFSFGIIISVFVILAEMGTILVVSEGPNLRGFNVFFNVVGFALTPLIPIILVSIFDTSVLKRHYVILVPTLINGIFVLLSPFFGFIFAVDKFNMYARGDLFFIFVLTYIINIFVFLTVTWINSVKYFYPIKWKLAFLTLFSIGGTFVQLLYPGVYSSWHAVTLTLFLLYILLSEFEGSFDALTKLYNRHTFEKASRQISEKNKFAIVLLDINEFKEVNDTYGHDYGDVVLKQLADSIREAFDKHCSFYRIGGDEFCVIRRDNNKERLEEQIKTMSVSLSRKRKINSSLPSIAYGYCIKDSRKHVNFQTVFKVADEQMYIHKEHQKRIKYNNKKS